MGEKILLIGDLAGYGKVALSAMFPVLSHMGFDLYNLPTALVSNTFDYGKYQLLETTDYMKNTLSIWEELEFSFDSIFTGFIASKEQGELVSKYCKEQSEKNVKIFVDPIMGDDSKLYNGIEKKTIDYMREFCAIADYIMPNFTEAMFLAGLDIKEKNISSTKARYIIDKLRAMGAKSIVVTSMKIEDQWSVTGYDFDLDHYFMIPFEHIGVSFPGTGDIFSASMMGNVLLGNPLETSVKGAMDYVKKLIFLNKENKDKFKGIPIEAFLHMM